MQDRAPTKPNRYAVYDDAHNFLRYEYHERADEPTQEGDALNKANLLPDEVATALGLTGNPQVKDALEKLKTLVDIGISRAQIATGSYTGTGTYGSGNPVVLTSSFPIKMIALGLLDTYDAANTILEKQELYNLSPCIKGGNFVRMVFPTSGAVQYIYFALSLDGKTVRFYSDTSSYNQYNAGPSDNGGRFKNNYYVFIG